MFLRRRKGVQPADPAAGTAQEPTVGAAASQERTTVPPDVVRMTAVEWARKHQMNAVMAERAAMYAGKRNEPLTEQEFLDMLRRTDV